jgi:hypothetical protein
MSFAYFAPRPNHSNLAGAVSEPRSEEAPFGPPTGGASFVGWILAVGRDYNGRVIAARTASCGDLIAPVWSTANNRRLSLPSIGEDHA